MTDGDRAEYEVYQATLEELAEIESINETLAIEEFHGITHEL